MTEARRTVVVQGDTAGRRVVVETGDRRLTVQGAERRSIVQVGTGLRGEPGPPGETTLEGLTDVDTQGKAPGQFLYFDGSEWKPANLDGGTFN